MTEEKQEPSLEDLKKMLGIPTRKSTFSLQGVSSSVQSASSSAPESEEKPQVESPPVESSEKVEENEEVKAATPGTPEYVPPPAPPKIDEDFSPAKVYRLGWTRDDSDEEEEIQQFQSWKEPKTLAEKRKLYRCGKHFVTLSDIPNWMEYGEKNSICRANPKNLKYSLNEILNSKVSIYYGDITTLEIDGVVNAANRSLLGGGGIDGAIHQAAGRNLLYECRRLNGCSTGFTKVTRGFHLPAKYILHTVGPVNGDPLKLRSCYRTCLENMLENNMKTIAFCCVATGIFGFPLQPATKIALEETRKFLEINHEKIDRIIFCVFLKIEKEMYEYFVPWYFPRFKGDEKGDDLPQIQKSKPPKKKKWWQSSSDEDEDDD